MARMTPLPKILLLLVLGSAAACSGKPSAVVPASAVSSMQSIELKTGAGEAVTAGKIAVVQSTGADGGAQLTAFGTPHAGQYELIALQAGGQCWRVPNQLSARVTSQGVRLHIDRSSR
mgnify:CR=1 FL=1